MNNSLSESTLLALGLHYLATVKSVCRQFKRYVYIYIQFSVSGIKKGQEKGHQMKNTLREIACI